MSKKGDLTMITCDECGKLTGKEFNVGTHWLCLDCKVESLLQESTGGKPSINNETATKN
jgi:ribosomal protein S27E